MRGHLDLRGMTGRRRPVALVPTREFFQLTRQEQLSVVIRYLNLSIDEVELSRRAGGGARALPPMARAMDAADEARRLLALVKGGG